MNFKTTIVLLALLVLAAGALVFVQHSDKQQTSTEDHPAPGQGRKLFQSTTAREISRVAIADADGKQTVFQRDAADFKKWDMTQPMQVPANASTVGSLLSTVLELQSSSQVDGSDKDTTGLDKPQYHVELTPYDANAKPIVLDIGKKDSIGDTVFVMLAGSDKVDVVPTAILDTLGKKIDDWRDKKLVSASSSDIKQLQIDRPSTQPGMPDQQVDLAKTSSGWTITGPKAMPADQSSVDSMVSSLTFLEAAEFVKPDAPAAKYARFDQPRLTVRFSTIAPTTSPSPAPGTQPTLAGTVITFGQYDDILKHNVFTRLSGSPQVYKVAASSLSSFEKSSLDLRNREALNIDPTKVSSIKLVYSKHPTTGPADATTETRTVSIERRKQSLILGPMLPTGFTPPAATTQPTTQPGTQPSSRLTTPSPFSALFCDVTADATTLPVTQSTTQQDTVSVGSTTEPSPATLPIVAEVPATAPTTMPAATMPAIMLPSPPPPSKWTIDTARNTTGADGQVKTMLDSGQSANEEQVQTLLDALHPLTVQKYLESAPTTRPAADYVLTVSTVGAGGADTATYQIEITDSGGDAKLIGRYGELTFELDRALLTKLDGDFKTAKPATPPPAAPMGGGAGGFPGGFPGGGQ